MNVLKIVAISLMSTVMLVATHSGVAQTPKISSLTEESSKTVKAALEKLNGGEVSDYRIGWFDLDGDGTQESVVLMTGSDWCGSGGCTLVVLKQDAASWRVVSQIPTSRPPVAVLDSKTNGWRDLAIVTQGGGQPAQKEVILRFQKGRYVKHPEKATKGGKIIIP